MAHEGVIVDDTATVVKSEIIHQIRRLGPTTPEELERATFQVLVGRPREDVDWDLEDNQAGYFTWLKSFDQLVGELIDDDYIRVEELEGTGQRTLVPTEELPDSKYSQHW
jgi:hypothetical protein